MPKYLNKSIPLHCTLCPKEPRFSDISHLLTHISSKSHLSHRFKLQIRSQAEQVARRQLDDFETWYTENGIEDLLSERLAVKEHKNASKRPRNYSVPRKTEAKIGTNPEVKREIKVERRKGPSLSATPKFKAPVPAMYTWSTRQPFRNQSWQESPGHLKQGSGYETPTTRRQIPNFGVHQSFDHASRVTVQPAPGGSEETEEEKDVDTSKLKGILWPGMDLFDSATMEMKKKRNQKKDGSVLAQMMLNSAVVEPNEWVFHADGDVYKIKPIFGDSTDTSPVKSEIDPTPKRRRTTRKTALSEADINAAYVHPYFPIPGPKKAARKRGRTSMDSDIVSARLTENPFGAFGDMHFAPSAEEDEEFKLTMEDMGKKQPLGIFRDFEVASPGRTESPLEEARFGFPYDGLPLGPLDKNNLLDISPTPIFKPIAMRFSDKENMQFHTIDHQNMSNASGYPPQMFHDHSINPLFQSHAYTLAYGEQPPFIGDVKPLRSSFVDNFRPDMPPPPLQDVCLNRPVKRTHPMVNNTQFRV